MDSTESRGVIRKMDELGRIVLPMSTRKRHDINPHDELEVIDTGDGVIITKYKLNCVFCGSSTGLTTFRGRKVCRDCMKKLTENT